MTAPAKLEEISRVLGTNIAASGDFLYIAPENLLAAAAHLNDPAGLDFEYLDMITAVDYPDGFELVYRFLSLKRNESVTIKTRLNKTSPAAPSLAALWRGADLQEREIYDLFGIAFAGHPCLKRIVLWEGFPGHPLRKDYQSGA